MAVAAFVALSGCSNSGSSTDGTSSASTTPSSVIVTVPTTVDASTLGSATALATPAPGAVADAAGQASTAVAESYCEAALQAQAATNAFNALGADPRSTADPAAVFDAYVATINNLAASAPPQLAADLRRNADAMAMLKPILAAAGYDIAKAFENPAINAILTPEVNVGSQRINDYNAATCGMSGATTTTTLGAP